MLRQRQRLAPCLTTSFSITLSRKYTWNLEGRAQNVAGLTMACRSCESLNQATFPAEINIHFPGIENLTKPTVWAFPTLLVCLDCGFAEFGTGEDVLSVRLLFLKPVLRGIPAYHGGPSCGSSRIATPRTSMRRTDSIAARSSVASCLRTYPFAPFAPLLNAAAITAASLF